MGLEDIRDRLEKRFYGKYCKSKGELNIKGELIPDVSHVDFKEVIRIITRIVDISDLPSAKFWKAKLEYKDGSMSNWFVRMSDVEIKKEK